MKRAGLNCGALVIIVMAVLFGMPLMTRNQTTQAAAAIDYLNPVVPCTTVYVSTQAKQVEWLPNEHGGRDYRYVLTAYDRCGLARQLMIQVTDQPLAPDTYLAVKTKGQKVLRWQPVKRAELPNKIRAKLMPTVLEAN